MRLRRGNATGDNGAERTVISYGPNPVTAEEIGDLNQSLGSRLNGSVGEIPIGDPQTRQYHGWLAPQQHFVGAMQLQNLVNAKIGLSTAIPATKPNPGVIPPTPMQRLLFSMNQPNMGVAASVAHD
jgi:hypothetical protein